MQKDIIFTLHHACIYDTQPRDTVWPLLRWRHGITNYLHNDPGQKSLHHISDEGWVDYTFLGCGSRFLLQLEAPPFQFEYEQNWFAKHGRGINHVCWTVNNAKAAFDRLVEAGATIAQEYTEFGLYNGFVVMDPEGCWIEIMEYTHSVYKSPMFETWPHGWFGLQMLGVTEVCADLDATCDWYCAAMDLRKVFEGKEGDARIIYLADHDYDPQERNIVMALCTPRNSEEARRFEEVGPFISAINYTAMDLHEAYAEALKSELESVSPPAKDSLTGAETFRIREMNGNILEVRERFQPAA